MNRKRKAYGQHFLTDRKVLQRIVRGIAPAPEDVIIEIGAGKGVLTRALAKRAGKVIAIEKDISLIPRLRETVPSNVIIVEKDVLRLTFSSLFSGPAVKVAGNLPYAISSPLLFKVLEERHGLSSCYFLLQREVAERLCAAPGSKKYAPLSLLFHNAFMCKLRFLVPPTAFSPPPRVESAFVALHKRPAPLYPTPDEPAFRGFLKAAFQHRRKTLYNNLRRRGWPPSDLKSAFLTCGVAYHLRAEQTTLAQFVTLFDTLVQRKASEANTSSGKWPRLCYNSRNGEEKTEG